MKRFGIASVRDGADIRYPDRREPRDMRILCIGHSHMNTLARAARARAATQAGLEIIVLQLRADEFRFRQADGTVAKVARQGPKRLNGVNQAAISAFIERCAPMDAVVLCLNGNEHNVGGLFRGPARRPWKRESSIRDAAALALDEWLGFLLPRLRAPAVLVPPPPPVESESLLRKLSQRLGDEVTILPASERLKMWTDQLKAIYQQGARHEVPVLELPEAVFDARRFLAAPCIGNDATHGNDHYGSMVIEAILDAFDARTLPAPPAAPAPRATKPSAGSTSHPYRDLPESAFWHSAVALPEARAIDPQPSPGFEFGPEHRIATAGSCFAQHISRWLSAHGYNFFVTEARDPAQEADPEYAFSALYGNIYTSRQFVQLFERAFGVYTPQDGIWQRPDGRYCDAFRPRHCAAGYSSPEDVRVSQGTHLACVRRMFRELDVLVFTLGLTECFASRLDGAVYPLAPGVVAGQYSPDRHSFLNLGVSEVVSDLGRLLAKLREVNPTARVVLTVSPVPLVATASGNHVLIANTRSKAVLRAAADEIAATHDHVAYFPSYEIISGAPGKLGYFEADCRSVSPAGVAHVMGVFMRSMTRVPIADAGPDADIEALLDAECDEEILSRTP